MNLLIYLSHPAQFLFYKNIIKNLKNNNHNVYILIKSKDVLVDLLKESGYKYINIQTKERKKNKLSIIISLIKRDIKIWQFVKKHKIDLLLGTDASLSHISKLKKIPCITTLEDDFEVIKSLAKLTYPFTSTILTPQICSVGKWEYKKTGYNGYMKLAYLHPKYFKPEINKLTFKTNKPFVLIRLSALNAHHDFGIKGIRQSFLDQLITELQKSKKVFITSENELPEKFKNLQLNIKVSDIHHYLYYADLLISDSQSMSVEAAILGTPSIRISSFSGKISVLEELETKYQLTFGFHPDNETSIEQKINELISNKDLKQTFQNRRQKMLSKKIDVTAFSSWFIENYPESADIMKKNPDYQYNFK